MSRICFNVCMLEHGAFGLNPGGRRSAGTKKPGGNPPGDDSVAGRGAFRVMCWDVGRLPRSGVRRLRRWASREWMSSRAGGTIARRTAACQIEAEFVDNKTALEREPAGQ